MRISVKTVDRHAAALMAKLNIHDRVQLARFAIREGITQA
jgi:DNA-binding NarL/FixJ family response regulator